MSPVLSAVDPHSSSTKSLPTYTPVHQQYVMRPEDPNNKQWDWLPVVSFVAIFFTVVTVLIYKRFSATKQRPKKQRSRITKLALQAKRKGKSKKDDINAPEITPDIPVSSSNFSVLVEQVSDGIFIITLRIEQLSSASVAYAFDTARNLKSTTKLIAQRFSNAMSGPIDIMWPTAVQAPKLVLSRLHALATCLKRPTPETLLIDLNAELSDDDATVSADSSENYDGDSEAKAEDVDEFDMHLTVPIKRRRRKSKAERRKALQEQLKLSKMGGLYNEGNTCFMNSVIQSLASLDSFEMLLDELNGSGLVPSSPSVLLRELINQVNTKSTSQLTYSTNKLVESMSLTSSRWQSSNQEDAQEYFQQVLSFLEKDMKSILKSPNDTPRILTPFDGETAIRVGCLTCGEMDGIRKEVMSSVSLSLTDAAEHVDLLDLLDEYSQLEIIPGVECYRCGLRAAERDLEEELAVSSSPESIKQLAKIREALKLPVIDEKLRPLTIKRLSDKSKQTMFARPNARVLAVHVNRSVFVPSTGFTRKNLSPVSFPEELNLAPYVVRNLKDPRNRCPRYAMTPVDVRRKHGRSESEESEAEIQHNTGLPSFEVDLVQGEPLGNHQVEADSSVTESTMDNQWSRSTTPNTSVGPSPLLMPMTSILDVAYLDLDSSANADDDALSPRGRIDHSDSEDGDLIYKLKAVIVHHGSHNFGHYICYRRCRHGFWWKASDQTVVRVDENTVLGAQGGVFMLFYEMAQEATTREEWVKAKKRKLKLSVVGSDVGEGKGPKQELGLELEAVVESEGGREEVVFAKESDADDTISITPVTSITANGAALTNPGSRRRNVAALAKKKKKNHK